MKVDWYFSLILIAAQPVKPTIQGNLSIYVSKCTELICSSKSTSAPGYYFKRISLSYTWYMNNTKVNMKSRKRLKLCVTRDLKYNRYSCTATEDDLESDRSAPVQINPLCMYNIYLCIQSETIQYWYKYCIPQTFNITVSYTNKLKVQ